ncbi:DoxX family protein [Jejudonia soesokkakensis]|uniref:DoxX family protein n=1 Tax=Jejudonia soesokkakensis TaxID=1323432 RepID=A0ABW2MNA4_9FLAO
MRTQKSIYWIATAALCLLFLYSAGMYFINTEMVKGFFKSFNYPSYLVIPLAIAKVVAVGMIVWRKSKWLTEWAYAGLFFDLILAFLAHYKAADGGTILPLVGMIVLLLSYLFGKDVRYN